MTSSRYLGPDYLERLNQMQAESAAALASVRPDPSPSASSSQSPSALLSGGGPSGPCQRRTRSRDVLVLVSWLAGVVDRERAAVQEGVVSGAGHEDMMIS